MSVKVDTIKNHNESETIKVLVKALVDDPIKGWYFSNGVERIYHTTWIINRMSRVLKDFGHNYNVTDNAVVRGAALWIPPGITISYLQMIRHGLLILPFRVGIRKFYQIMKSLDTAEKIQSKIMKDRKHWQLFYIGIEPGHQGKGYGSRLMESVIQLADKNNEPIFIQNFTVDNTKFYEKHGFQVIDKYEFGKNCLMRSMLREPNETNKKPGLQRKKTDKSKTKKTKK